MASSLIALWLSLATVGGDGGSLLRGVVIGADGRPAAGAEVVVAGGASEGEPPVVLGRARSDGAGRFEARLAERPGDGARPILWAILAGSVGSSVAIDRDPTGGRSYQLVLGPPPGARFSVAGPDGHAVLGAKIRPRRVAREVAEVPEVVARLASATTDAGGNAMLDAFRPEEILEVVVEADGFGAQVRRFDGPEGFADPGTKGITLRPCGRVQGRVVADDPKAVAGLAVLVNSTAGPGGVDTALAEVQTDAEGRFEVGAIASGSITVRVRPREGALDLPAKLARGVLDAGKSVEVQIPLRRGVKVAGLVVDERDARPIAGVMVAILPPGSAEPVRARTDAEGRYEAVVASGLVGRRPWSVPAPYLCPPPFFGTRPVEVPPAIARFELPRLALTRGVDIRGTVADADGRAVPSARVWASWTLHDGRVRAPRMVETTSLNDGSFVVGPVDPEAEVTLSASGDDSASGASVRVRPKDAVGKAVGLSVVLADAEAPGGRVIGPDGRGVANATVRIRAVDRSPAGAILGGSSARFDGSDALITDLEGRYRLPQRLRGDRDYVVIASAQGRWPGRSRPARPTAGNFPDLALADDPSLVAIEGRVIDRRGRPIPSALVRVSGDGPCRRRATTDPDGRFRLLEAPGGRCFLFVEAEHFRFFGRAFEKKEGGPQRPVEVTLVGIDETPDRTMRARPVVTGDLALARRVMGPYVDRVLSEGDHATRIKTLELLARVDPARVLALVEARGVEDAWFADHLRHQASRALPGVEAGERMAIIGAIRDAEVRALASIDAAGALPVSARALRREHFERAARDARTIADPARRAVALAEVADGLADEGEIAQASKLFEEARPIVEGLPATQAATLARASFAERLARTDLTAALALTEGITDPGAFDRCRVRIARRLASRDPSEAMKILDTLRDPRALARALPALCHALAPVAPALAGPLIARTRGNDPCLAPYALGMMALAVSATDKPAATGWLREAFERLGRISTAGPPPSGTPHDPATVAASLLPVAERVDPGLVAEFFWQALCLRGSRPEARDRSDALLALLLAPYDREVALALFRPCAERALAHGEDDLAPILAASAVLDPPLALRLVDRLPEPPDLTFHHPKNQARLALAAALARGTTDDLVGRWLKLWTTSRPDAD